MKLELEELELGETLKSQGYEEAVQCSPRCKNNDELIYKKMKCDKNCAKCGYCKDLYTTIQNEFV